MAIDEGIVTDIVHHAQAGHSEQLETTVDKRAYAKRCITTSRATCMQSVELAFGKGVAIFSRFTNLSCAI